MQTLDELCTFLGFPVGALNVARFSGQTEPSLEMAGLLIKGVHDRTPTSLAGLIDAVQNLPALTLDARLLSDRSGQEPYELRVRLAPSSGIVWFTTIECVLYGSQVFPVDKDFGAGGGDVSPIQLGLGSWEIFANRAGIGSFGLAVLRQSLGTVVVDGRPRSSPPTRKPPVVNQPTVPLVTCQISIDGTNPGSGGSTNYVISGSGFEAEEPVDVFEDQGLASSTKSDRLGGYAVKISILHSLPPVQHVFFARGQRSGRTSLNAGVTV